MAAKNVAHEPSLWDQLPAAERARVQKELADKLKQEPTKKGQKKNGQFELRGYARCELAIADKEAFKAWEEGASVPDVLLQLVTCCEDGYLLKCGYAGSSYTASLSAHTTSQDWDGYVLTAHAGGAARAAMLLWYKHAVLMSKTWSEWVGEDDGDSLR